MADGSGVPGSGRSAAGLEPAALGLGIIRLTRPIVQIQSLTCGSGALIREIPIHLSTSMGASWIRPMLPSRLSHPALYFRAPCWSLSARVKSFRASPCVTAS